MKPLFSTQLLVTVPLITAAALPLGSCNATSGAAAGALIGAGLGQLAGGDTESTVVGAVIGAGLGAAIGFNVEKKREARVLASRQAAAEELEEANRAAAAVSRDTRKKAIDRAKAYEAKHAAERVAKDPVEPGPTADGDPAAAPEPSTTAESAPTVEPAAPTQSAGPVLIEVVRLPGTDGVMLKNLETGRFINEEVHVLEDIKDVTGETPKAIKAGSGEAALPFTLILSDEETGETREYTAIYSS